MQQMRWPQPIAIFCKWEDQNHRPTIVSGKTSPIKIRREYAKNKQITRAAAAIEYAAKEDFEGIIVIGNAPTSLFKSIELVENGELNAKSIVGVPVGFVKAADSKEALSKTNIPHVITRGPKGGTPVAVACVNSLISTMKNENYYQIKD